LPAQLWSFSPDAQAVSLARNGLEIAPEQILKKVLLFMAHVKNPALSLALGITDAPDFIPICLHKPAAGPILLLHQRPSRYVLRSPRNLFSKRKGGGNVCE
jgi:hypothetical protein